jgi:protein TonB
MLLERESAVVETGWDSHSPASIAPPAQAAMRGREPAYALSRYGPARRVNPTALAVTAAVHVVLGLALLGLNVHAAGKKRERMAVVELSTTPPPASQPEPQPQPNPPPRPVTMQPQAITLPRPEAAIVPMAPELPPTVEVARVAAPVMPAVPAAPAAPPAPPAPAIVESNDLGARMIAGDPPRYPIESRRRKEQGVVHLGLIVGTDGRVESIAVERSSGHDRLDAAAMKAVRKWRWEPTTRGGIATRVRGIVEIPFVLQAAG